MNFSILLGLCLFNLIHGRYLLVNVDDHQVREPKPPTPTCIPPKGKCFYKTKLSVSIEFSARSVKDTSRILKECCQGYTCVSGMCLKPRINIDGSGKMSDIVVEHESHSKPSLRFNDLGPMKMGEIKMFTIDPSKRDCRLNPDGVYYIKKESVNQKTYFFASVAQQFVLNHDITADPIKSRYLSQAGYTTCSPGYISNTETYDGTDGRVDVRNCGVGTVFATLCMVDPELYMLPSNQIDEEFKNHLKTARIIKKGCRKFLGLWMISEDVSGPYANFNAALRTGLNKFLIPNKKGKYVWMNTERARSCYDPETKTIGPEKIKVDAKEWWFCDEIKGSFPKFPNLDQCKNSR